MRNIMFYPRSRNITPHIDEEGTVHVCISKWTAADLIDRHDAKGGKVSKFSAMALAKRLAGMSQEGWRNLAATTPDPTNGTSQPSQ